MSMQFVVMTMCSMVKWSCFVFRWMHCGMSFHSRVVIVVTACTVRLPPCMNNIWTNRYYTLLEVDCHSNNIMTLTYWLLNIRWIYDLHYRRVYIVIFIYLDNNFPSKVVTKSRFSVLIFFSTDNFLKSVALRFMCWC